MSHRKPSRPRLERTYRSNLSAVVKEDYVELDSLDLDLRQCKRLHAFLTKAIAYLESQRKGGRK